MFTLPITYSQLQGHKRIESERASEANECVFENDRLCSLAKNGIMFEYQCWFVYWFRTVLYMALAAIVLILQVYCVLYKYTRQLKCMAPFFLNLYRRQCKNKEKERSCYTHKHTHKSFTYKNVRFSCVNVHKQQNHPPHASRAFKVGEILAQKTKHMLKSIALQLDLNTFDFNVREHSVKWRKRSIYKKKMCVLFTRHQLYIWIWYFVCLVFVVVVGVGSFCSGRSIRNGDLDGKRFHSTCKRNK